MKIPRRLAETALTCAACIFLNSAALAIDLTGVWATDADKCDKVFEKKGSQISFQPDSDIYGGGFIMEGRRIRGRTATCNITKSKEDGATIHMIASCATDIMYSNMQFSVKVINDNTIARIFPGLDGMDLNYYRCQLK